MGISASVQLCGCLIEFVCTTVALRFWLQATRIDYCRLQKCCNIQAELWNESDYPSRHGFPLFSLLLARLLQSYVQSNWWSLKRQKFSQCGCLYTEPHQKDPLWLWREHDHPPNNAMCAKERVMSTMRKRAREESTSINRIYDDALQVSNSVMYTAKH